jgi:hypothetical protein
MSLAAAIGLFTFTVLLYVAVHTKLISDATLQRLAGVAGVVALLAAIVVLVLPTTPISPNSSMGAPTTTATSDAMVTTPFTSTTTLNERNQAKVVHFLYPCIRGLCQSVVGSTLVQIVALFSTEQEALYGYTFSSDGTKIVYAIGAKAKTGIDHVGEVSSADIYVVDTDGSNSRKLFSITGTMSGNGALQRFGVLGLSADNTQVIFEHDAQIFVSELDGTERRSITPRIEYPGARIHYYVLSPQSTVLMRVPYGGYHSVETYNVANGGSKKYDIEPPLSPALFSSDDNHIIAYRYEQAFDPAYSPNAQGDRPIIGYDEVHLQEGKVRPIKIDASYKFISNISNGFGLVQRKDRPTELLLLTLSTGNMSPVQVINYTEGHISVFVNVGQ